MGLYTSNSPQPLTKGAPAQVYPANYQPPFNGFPTAVLSGTGNAWNSGVIPIFGLPPPVAASGVLATPQNLPKQQCWWSQVSAALTSTQAVTITITCYIDSGGLCPVGTVGTSNSSTTPYAGGNPGLPFLYFQVTITNTSGTTAIITNPGIAVSAS
jgi:hypothetical protein